MAGITGALAPTVSDPPEVVGVDRLAVPDSLAGLATHAFPSADLVRVAAGLLSPLPAWDGREGPRRRLLVGPGMLRVGSHDPARAERAAERAVAARRARVQLAAIEVLLPDLIAGRLSQVDAVGVLAAQGLVSWAERDDLVAEVGRLTEHARAVAARDERVPEASITSWSGRSRSRMIRTLASLDYTPLLAEGRSPAMVTITLPGDWLAIAPSARVMTGLVNALKRRYLREWGAPLVGVWKREFQARGAPHYHVLMTPPVGTVDGMRFPEWLAHAWVAVCKPSTACVCGGGCEPVGRLAAAYCSEAARMLRSHLHVKTVDYGEGARASDPKRLAVYFSKHGSFAAKDYQNDAPAEWVKAGSVGRFWGVWGLDQAVAVVEVSHAEALAAARTLRRWSRANSYVAARPVWRFDTARAGRVDPGTGEVTASPWRKRSVRRRVTRMKGSLGYLTVNDGPSMLATLAPHLDAVRESAQLAELVALGYEPWFSRP